MTSSSDSVTKRALKTMGGWLYGLMIRPGWKRWIMLVTAFLAFLILFFLAWQSIDYRNNPAALAPRSAVLYAETRDLPSLFAETSGWPLWNRERRQPTGEPWSQLQVDFAGMVGGMVEGLGTRLPLSWLNASKMAALCLAPADDGAGTTWALYLDFPGSDAALAEMRVEPDLTLKPVPAVTGAYELTSKKGGGTLHFVVKAPWFIISPHDKLPRFALGSAERPSFSLAYAGLVPDWPRGAAVRGCADPSRFLTDAAALPVQNAMLNWLAPDARIGFSYRLNDDGVVTASYQMRFLEEQVAGGGIWPLVRLLCGLAAILVLALLGATLLCMIGWGGWLKLLAIRAGVIPAAEPAPATASEAFCQDAGLRATETPPTENTNGEPSAPLSPTPPETTDGKEKSDSTTE